MKKLSLFFLAITLLFAGQSFAQTPAAGREVSGVVQDSTGTGLLGAVVTLKAAANSKDSVTIRTNIDGIFVLKGVKVSQFVITVKSLGFSTYNKRFLYTDGTSRIVLDKIILKAGANMLEEVVITGAPPVTVKQDTVEYRASDFKLKENAVVEDLIKRLDGVEVDKDGNVSSQGKSVTKFRVNGKDYFGGDLKTATKNIPADAIDKIQLVDDYGDQANFTGVRDGDPETIINVTTRPGRNKGFIANATAGGGSDELYQFSGFANQIKAERNLGITANLNNNGTQVGGAGFGGRGGGGGGGNTGGGGGNTGGGRGGNGGGGNTGAGFGVSNGLTTLGSVGLNYSDRWSPKVVVTGAYYYNNNDNSTITSTVSEIGNIKGTTFGNSTKDQGTISNSHNLNGRFQYNINKSNLLTIQPSISFYNSRSSISSTSLQTGVIHQDQNTTSGTKGTTPSYGANVLYNHLFKKIGRNYSLNLNVRNNDQNSDDDNDNTIKYYDANFPGGSRDSLNHRLNVTNNQTFTGTSRFIYSEPLSLRSRFQFSYNLSYSDYNNSKVTNFVGAAPTYTLQKIDSLSNIFQYSFTSHQLGLNYNFRNQNNELSLGLTGNPTELSGNSVTLNTTIHRTNFYLAPIFAYTYRYSRTKALMVRYFGRAVEPQFSQLQPVTDVSNPQRPIIGNPNLNSSFSHQMLANYNTSNPQKHTSFFFNINGLATKDKIVMNTVLVDDSVLVGNVETKSYKQEIRYLNTNGAYSYGGNYNWQKSFADRQYTFRLNGYAGYNQNVAFTDNEKNFSKQWDFRQGVGLMINPGTWLELTPTFAYSLSDVNYTLASNTDTKIQTYSFNVDGNLFFLKSRSLILRFNGGKSFNSGYATDALNTNPLIINSSIEKQFLKNRTATIRLQAFDLLNQSNNITHTDLGYGFNDARTNRLTQYFMLTLVMRVNRFAGASVGGGGGQRGGGNGGFGGGGGGQRGGGGF